MKKRVLSMILCFVMIITLTSVTGFAEEGSSTGGAEITNPETGYSTRRDLSLKKTLSDNGDGTFDLQLESYATGKIETDVVTHQTPTDFIFVVDQSGSMAYKDMPMDYEPIDKETWTISDIEQTYDTSSEAATGAYYYKDPNTGDYYRVYKKWGAMYELVPRNSLYLQQLIDLNSLSWFRDAGEQEQSFDSMYYYQPSADPLISNTSHPDNALVNDDNFYPVTMSVENAPLYYFMQFKYTDINNTDRTMRYYYDPNEQSTDQENGNAIWYYNSLQNRSFGPTDSFGGVFSYNYINRLVVYAAGEGTSPATALIYGTFGGTPATGFYDHYTYAEFSDLNTGMYVQNPMFIGHVGYHELCYRDSNGVEHYLIDTDYCDSNDVPLDGMQGEEASWNGTLYRIKNDTGGQPQTETRLQALNTSLKTFVDEVAGQTDSDGSVNHRIAIVGYAGEGDANNEILSGVSLTHGATGSMSTEPGTTSGYSLDGRTHDGTQYSNSISPDTYYSSLVNVATTEGTVDETNVSSLKTSVDAITAKGGTQPETGFAMAQKIIEARNSRDGANHGRNTVVIFFTDGRPGDWEYSNQYDEANDVVLAAKGVKDLGAKVYSVGIFNEADGNPLTYRQGYKFYTGEDLNTFRDTACQNNGTWHNHLLGNGTLGDGYSVNDLTSELLIAGYQLEQRADNGKFIQEYRTNFVRKTGSSSKLYYTSTWYWGSNNSHYASASLPYEQHYFYYRDCLESTRGYPEQPDDTIADYMTTVSSTYPSASSFDGDWNSNPSGTYSSTISSVRGTAASKNYYMLCTNTDRLEEVFINISHDVDVAGTTVNLDENAVLKDIVNTDVFSVPAQTQIEVYTQNMEAQSNNGSVSYSTTGDAVLNNDLTNLATVDENGVVRVTGFDYEQHYVMPNPPDGVTGQKLIVKITGLTPTAAVYSASDPVNTNNGAGIYAVKNGEESQIASVEVESPTLKISAGAPATYVVDFNGKMILAQNASMIGTPTNNNGTFTVNNTSKNALYQLNSTIGTAKNASDRVLAFNGVDTAKIYGKHTDLNGSFESSASTKDITVVPASSVYIDDDLKDIETAVTDGHGYTAAAITQSASDVTGSRYFTFTGTGIDVYCTTHNAGGYVSAALYNGDASNVAYANIVKDSSGNNMTETVKNYSSESLYNVPSVHFDGLTYGTYTLKIYADSGASYKLDGVRVYGVVDDETAYEGTTEANANYFNLRDYLLNNNTAYTALNKTEAEIGAEQFETISGVLYLDDFASIVAQNKMEDGTIQNVYKNTYDAYQNNSPKNEIYLTGSQAVSFMINNWSATSAGAKVYVGLSTPRGNGKNIAVKINGTEIDSINSATDMYYDITDKVTSSGVVTIEANSGEEIVSVTNLKITGTALSTLTGQDVPNNASGAKLFAAKRMAFAAVTTETIQEIAEEEEPAVVTEDPEEPGETEDPQDPETPGETVEDPEEPGESVEDPEETPTPTPGQDDDQETEEQPAIGNVIQRLVKSISSFFRSIFRR